MPGIPVNAEVRLSSITGMDSTDANSRSRSTKIDEVELSLARGSEITACSRLAAQVACGRTVDELPYVILTAFTERTPGPKA